MKTTTAIIFETRRTFSDGTHPVKLRVTHNRKQEYYTLNILNIKTGLSDDVWSFVMADRPRGKYKAMRDSIQKSEAIAQEIIQNIPVFSFKLFKTQFFNKESAVDIFVALQEKVDALNKDDKFKTAFTYLGALKSLKKYTNKEKFLFKDVTPEFLKKYEIWMLKNGRQKNTISVYLRACRALYDKNKKDDSYPFGQGRYQIPTGQNVKKALTIDQIGKIYNYKAETPLIAKSRDLFMFSYLCNGMNFKDMAYLKYKDVDDESIVFVRAKTANKISRPVILPLTVEIGRLIDTYGNKPAFPNQFVLPILSKEMDAKQKEVAINNSIRLVNDHLKKIAKNIGITVNVTTYTARHSFATVLKRSGASIEFISESLGHKNLTTTENYLADFEMDKKKEMAALLTKWNDPIEISNPPELIKVKESFQKFSLN